MTYLYQPIWEAIKANRFAEVTIGRDVVDTVIQGVKRTKCAENSTRANAGLIPWSRMKITKELLSERTGMWKVKFELIYDTRL